MRAAARVNRKFSRQGFEPPHGPGLVVAGLDLEKELLARVVALVAVQGLLNERELN